MYEEICKANDRPSFKGSSLFEDHFEVNGEGIITFVKPPHKKYSSMEVYCFLISIMVNQHIRIIHDQTNMLVKEAEKKFNELYKVTEDKLNKKIEELGCEENKCQKKVTKKTTTKKKKP